MTKIKLDPKSSCLVIDREGAIEAHMPACEDDESINTGAMLVAMCLVLLSDTPFGDNLRTMVQDHMLKEL